MVLFMSFAGFPSKFSAIEDFQGDFPHRQMHGTDKKHFSSFFQWQGFSMLGPVPATMRSETPFDHCDLTGTLHSTRYSR